MKKISIISSVRWWTNLHQYSIMLGKIWVKKGSIKNLHHLLCQMVDKPLTIFSYVIFIVIAFLCVCASVVFCTNQRVNIISVFQSSVVNVSVLVITIVIVIIITSFMIIFI